MNPCSVKWCVAMALPEKDVCACHLNNRGLHPQEYKRDNTTPKHFPTTPWDDEKPWYEVYR